MKPLATKTWPEVMCINFKQLNPFFPYLKCPIRHSIDLCKRLDQKKCIRKGKVFCFIIASRNVWFPFFVREREDSFFYLKKNEGERRRRKRRMSRHEKSLAAEKEDLIAYGVNPITNSFCHQSKNAWQAKTWSSLNFWS